MKIINIFCRKIVLSLVLLTALTAHADVLNLNYDLMVGKALRGVVKETLQEVERIGELSDDRCFYISFLTDYPGVSIPANLKEAYPEEITIILQYAFWDLDVGNKDFAVTLRFGNIKERIAVPFDAITSFTDPAMRFGLAFQASGEEEEGSLVDLTQELAGGRNPFSCRDVSPHGSGLLSK